MKKVTFFAGDYHKIIDTCTPCVDKAYSARPILCNIELQVKNCECIATSLNGYILAQCKVPCKGDNGVYILPSIKMKWYEDVTIIQKGDKISVSQGEVTYTKTQKQKGFIDWKPVVSPKNDIRYSINIDPKLAKQIFSALKSERCLRLDFRGELDPIQIVGINDRAILLPIRANTDQSKWFNFDQRSAPIIESSYLSNKKQTITKSYNMKKPKAAAFGFSFLLCYFPLFYEREYSISENKKLLSRWAWRGGHNFTVYAEREK